MKRPIKILCIVLSLAAIVLMLVCAKTIFPFVSNCEYYEENYRVDKNISIRIIHNSDCPLNHSKWFTVKENKYNILIKENADFCTVCFDEYEIRKLIVLHKMNLKDLYLRYKAHYTKEETDSLMRKYKRFYDED